jgi:hypothetical protein
VITHGTTDRPTWEMHPAGDEVVGLLSGRVDLVMEDGDRECSIALAGRAAVIVLQGVWHRALVYEPCDMLFTTRGAGTRHRPV